MKIQDKDIPSMFQRKVCWAALTGLALLVVVALVCGFLFGVGSLFVALGYTPAFPRKPNPASMHHIAEKWGVSPAEITLVGDSLFDARCAENAGTGLVLVGWGYAADPAALRAWPAPVCETMEDLARCLLTD